MNPGLVWLLRMGPRAWLRSLGRKVQGGKRVLLVVGVVFVLLVMVGGQVPQWIDRAKHPERAAGYLETARLVTPLAMTFLILLIDLSGRGLYFRPAEIDFLFPAPVSRRDLLIYQLVARGGMSMLSGLWTAIFVLQWAGTIVGGFVAVLLTMVFLQLTSQVGSLAIAALGARWAPKARIAFWGAVAAFAIVGARSSLAAIEPDASTHDALVAFAESPFVVVATAPTQPFAQLFTADTYGGVLLWLLACVAEMALMVVLLLRLDVAFEEAALASSRKMQERIRRMRSGEGAFLPSAGSARRRRIPRLPRLGGIGPVARRQLLDLVRNPSSVVWTTVSLLFCAGIIVVIGSGEGEGRLAGASYGAAAAAIALTTFANQGFTFDFRRDLDRMAELKMLPLRPAALCAGQLVAPTIVFTLVQSAALVIVFAFGNLPPWAALVAAFVLPPWNWISSALDNALFLLLPYRIAPEDTARVPFIGKMLLTMMMKSVAVGGVAVGVAVPVAVGFAIDGGAGGAAVWVGAAVGWCVLAAAAVASTWLVAFMFRRFDVARDV